MKLTGDKALMKICTNDTAFKGFVSGLLHDIYQYLEDEHPDFFDTAVLDDDVAWRRYLCLTLMEVQKDLMGDFRPV